MSPLKSFQHGHTVECLAFSNEKADACIIEHVLSAADKKEAKEARLKLMEKDGKDFQERAGRFIVAGYAMPFVIFFG